MTLFEKYGEKKDNGYEVKNDKRDEFLKEYCELCNAEIKLDAEKVVIKSDISIDASSVLALENLVEFEI